MMKNYRDWKFFILRDASHKANYSNLIVFLQAQTISLIKPKLLLLIQRFSDVIKVSVSAAPMKGLKADALECDAYSLFPLKLKSSRTPRSSESTLTLRN